MTDEMLDAEASPAGEAVPEEGAATAESIVAEIGKAVAERDADHELRKRHSERQFRSFGLEQRAIDVEARTVNLAFSSEEPVARSWGVEILDHGPGSMRTDFIGSGRAPLLLDHDPEKQIGVVEEVTVGPDRVGRARVRFGRSDKADEIFQDVVDGIRSNVSVGYMVEDELSRSKDAQGREVYRVAFRPLELSLVSIPADTRVGVGRSSDIPSEISEPKEVPTMTIEMNDGAIDAAKAERERAAAILELGARHSQRELAEQAVREGASVDQFRGALLDKVGQKPLADPGIGMTEKEVREFSFLRAVNALMNPTDARIQKDAAFEREVSRAAAQQSGKAERGFVVPVDVLKRDLITGTATSTAKGGNLIQTDVLGGSFIDVLRNAMVLPSVGARFLTGLQGNVAIPKRTTNVTAYWPGENTAPTEGVNVFGQVTMSPKVVAAYVDIGRRLAIQSSVDVEALVRDDLAQTLGLAIEAAALGGSTTNGPTGVRGTSGIGSVAIGTNGGAPTWASIVNLVKEVEIDNAMIGTAAFITNSKVKAKLAVTPRQSSGVEGNFLLGAPYSELYGFPVRFTNTVPSNLTKGSSSGVCSAMLFGVWSNLMLAQWGGIELTSDPFSLSTTGAVRIVALAEVDVAVRYAEAFAACLDYTTT